MLKCRRLKYASDQFRDDLMDHLRGRVFHLTPTDLLKQIKRAGNIFHNQSGNLKLHTSSHASFGRKCGWVCLFDFRGLTDEELDDTLFKYNFLRPQWLIHRSLKWTKSNVTYLFLHPTHYDELIPNSNGERGAFFIPKTECWYPGNLPLGKIEEALSVKIRLKATCGDQIAFRMESMRKRNIHR